MDHFRPIKTHSMKPTLALRSLLLGSALAVAPHASAATTVFADTFDYSGTPAPQTDLTTDVAARQAGGTVTSSYTKQTTGSAGNVAALNVANGQDTLLLQSSNLSGTSASQSAVNLGTNFATQLVGKNYAISLTDLVFTRGNADVTDVWFSISVGDSATGIDGPNQASADAGLLIRSNGAMTKWEDSTNLGSHTPAGMTLNFGFSTRFAMAELRIDETGATKTAQAYFKDTGGNEYTSPTWNIEFEDNTNRYFELRAHQGGTGTDGTILDLQIDSIAITAVPEPDVSTLLGGLGVLALWVRRRRN